MGLVPAPGNEDAANGQETKASPSLEGETGSDLDGMQEKSKQKQ